MTHEELLADINNLTQVDAIFMVDALRAVVELHKPKISPIYSDINICVECSDDEGEWFFGYPCPTIQAIEKELK